MWETNFFNKWQWPSQHLHLYTHPYKYMVGKSVAVMSVALGFRGKMPINNHYWERGNFRHKVLPSSPVCEHYEKQDVGLDGLIWSYFVYCIFCILYIDHILYIVQNIHYLVLVAWRIFDEGQYMQGPCLHESQGASAPFDGTLSAL